MAVLSERVTTGSRRGLSSSQRLPASGELQVWSAELDCPVDVARAFEPHLAEDELEKAARFRFQLHRDRYVVGRGILRTLIGRYLDCSAGAIRFAYDVHGKPALDHASTALSFNVSHSENAALYAFCVGFEIGVDVERLRPAAARERVAEHFFSASEVATLRSLAPELQPRAFLACWTRKEAFLKARGDGLTLPLNAFDVAFAPGEAPALLRTAWAPEEASTWALYDLSASLDDHVAALAVRSGAWRLTLNPSLNDPAELIQIGKEPL